MGRNIAVGQEIQSFTYKVDASKIREMAQALGDHNPLYLDSAVAQKNGYKDIIAPLTFGLAIKRWGSGVNWETTCKILDMDPLRVLHGEQEFSYYGPINPGDEITAHEKVIAVQDKAKMTLVILECEFKDQNGSQVLIARQTLVERKKGDQ